MHTNPLIKHRINHLFVVVLDVWIFVAFFFKLPCMDYKSVVVYFPHTLVLIIVSKDLANLNSSIYFYELSPL